MSCDKAAHLFENQSRRAPGLLDGCGLERRWESAFSSLCKCSICRGKKPSINVSARKKTKKQNMGTRPFVYGAKWFVSGVCVGMTRLCVVGVCVCLLSEYKYYAQASQRVDTHSQCSRMQYFVRARAV